MAVIGFQLLLTIIVLSILNKISNRYSFARWLLTKGGLVRYLHPSNEQLKEAIYQTSSSATSDSSTSTNRQSQSNANENNNHRASRRRGRNKGGASQNDNSTETFNVPRNVTLMLDCVPLDASHLIRLPYYTELQWLIDFSLCTILVYFSTEAYYTVFPAKYGTEYNLSIIWCCLALSFVVKTLFTITSAYFRGGDESIGERSMCIVSGCIFFLLSMIVLIPNEELLEFGLIQAYRQFSDSAVKLLEHQGKLQTADGPASFLMFRFWLAIACGLIGMLFTFPGLRLARMHKDALTYAQDDRWLTTLYHISFISPLLVVICWIKPIGRYFLTIRNWPNTGVLMISENFDSLRLCLILAIVSLRFGLFRRYLQAYLNIAPQKLTYMRKESGRITNVELQKLIARVSYYLCVASLQLLTPLLMCLFIALLSKSSGDYRWTGTMLQCNGSNSSMVNGTTTITANSSLFLVNSSLSSDTTTSSLPSFSSLSSSSGAFDDDFDDHDHDDHNHNQQLFNNDESLLLLNNNTTIINNNNNNNNSTPLNISNLTIAIDNVPNQQSDGAGGGGGDDGNEPPVVIVQADASKLLSNNNGNTITGNTDSDDAKVKFDTEDDEQLRQQAEQTWTLFKNLFNPIVLRGVIGFLLWWTVTVWFSTATVGFVYHSYFET